MTEPNHIKRFLLKGQFCCQMNTSDVVLVPSHLWATLLPHARSEKPRRQSSSVLRIFPPNPGSPTWQMTQAGHSCDPWASRDTPRRLQGDKPWKAVSDLESSVLACSEDPGHLSHCSYQIAPWITAEHSSSFLSWLLRGWVLPEDTNFIILAQRMDGRMVDEEAEGWMGRWLLD